MTKDTHKDSGKKSQPRAKKSETLEVRIPYETKQAFLTACGEDGTTASEVVRESVQTYLDTRERPDPQKERTLIMKFPEPVRRYGPRIAAGAVAAMGLATFVALPSAAAPDFASIFKKLDANGDGVLTTEEFAGPKPGQDGKDIVIETATRQVSRDGAAPPFSAGTPVDIKEDAFSFWLPDDLSVDGEEQQYEFKWVAAHEVHVQTDNSGAAPAEPPKIVSLDDIRKKEFAGVDADRDGKVSYKEFVARQRAMLTRGFEILDANGDKSLSADEYARIANPPTPKIGPGQPDAPEVTVRGKPMATPEAVKAAFVKLDANKDGKLSLQEYLPPA